jgi:hypothetical protein
LKSGIEEPRRFRRSKTVGAHFALTPQRLKLVDRIGFDGHNLDAFTGWSSEVQRSCGRAGLR